MEIWLSLILAPRAGMTSWSATSWATSKIVLWIGRSKNVRLPSRVNRSWTLRIRPSLLGTTLDTRASGHWFLGKSSSWSKTMSPSLLYRWGVFHFRLCWQSEEYSLVRHLVQNQLAKNCIRRHLFLEYNSKRSKHPGGGNSTSVFEVSRWLGVKGSGDSGSDRFSTVSGRLLMTFSASVIKVRNASSSSWLPCSCNRTDRTDSNRSVWVFPRTTHVGCRGNVKVKVNPITFLCREKPYFTRSRLSSCKASASSFLAPTKFVPWSERSWRTVPRLLIKRRNALIKESVSIVLRVSRWLKMNSARGQTCEDQTITLQRFSTFLNKKRDRTRPCLCSGKGQPVLRAPPVDQTSSVFVVGREIDGNWYTWK